MNAELIKKICEIHNFSFIPNNKFGYEDSEEKIVYEINNKESLPIQKHCEMLPFETFIISDIEKTALSDFSENTKSLMIVFETEKGLIVMDFLVFLDNSAIDADVLVYKGNNIVNIDPVRLRDIRPFSNYLSYDEFGYFFSNLKEKIIKLYFGAESTEETIALRYHGI